MPQQSWSWKLKLSFVLVMDKGWVLHEHGYTLSFEVVALEK